MTAFIGLYLAQLVTYTRLDRSLEFCQAHQLPKTTVFSADSVKGFKPNPFCRRFFWTYILRWQIGLSKVFLLATRTWVAQLAAYIRLG